MPLLVSSAIGLQGRLYLLTLALEGLGPGVRRRRGRPRPTSGTTAAHACGPHIGKICYFYARGSSKQRSVPETPPVPELGARQAPRSR